MRKFIVSDLHGNGEVYDSIMAYLENIALNEDVELYINGDLIDRGVDSYRMLEDAIARVNGTGNVKVCYLGGNHELSMYHALLEKQPGRVFDRKSSWIRNGGWRIERILDMQDNYDEKCEEFKDFLANLKICHEFEEIINKNKLFLVHAQIPEYPKEVSNLKIGDNNRDVHDAVWTRPEIRVPVLYGVGDVIGRNRIGKAGYLGIIGHTPTTDPRGFKFDEIENYFNIDGGCSIYCFGHFEFDHVPLVEVGDYYLRFLIFNHNNEIIDGYFYDGELVKLPEMDLNKERNYINHDYDNNGLENKKLIKELCLIES